MSCLISVYSFYTQTLIHLNSFGEDHSSQVSGKKRGKKCVGGRGVGGGR